MRVQRKVRAQEALEKILSGQFKETDVDILFSTLRHDCGEHRVFREIANFFAHPEYRGKGLIKETIEGYYLITKYCNEYVFLGRSLDFKLPFPIYLKRLMILQVDRCKPSELQQKFKISPEELKRPIDKLYKVDEEAKLARPEGNIGFEDLSMIKHLMGFMSLNPAFTVNNIMEDLVGVLQANDFIFEVDALFIQQAPIVLSLMLLLHKTKFAYDKKTTCVSYITYISSQVKEEEISARNDNPKIPVNTLLVTTVIKVEEDLGPLFFSPHLFQSDLSIFDYCEKSLLENGIKLPQDVQLLYFPEDLGLTDKFTLEAIHV